jgi:hypothetical protein
MGYQDLCCGRRPILSRTISRYFSLSYRPLIIWAQANRLQGGGMLAKAKDQDGVKLGENIIVGGLGIQVLFFGFFIIVSAIFHYRINLVPTLCAHSISVPWQQYLFILYAASALILVRSVFRIAEYVMGGDGILLRHEYYLYIFDATLMFLMMVLFNLRHPSNIIASHKKDGHLRDPESQDSGYPLEENVYVPAKR